MQKNDALPQRLDNSKSTGTRPEGTKMTCTSLDDSNFYEKFQILAYRWAESNTESQK